MLYKIAIVIGYMVMVVFLSMVNVNLAYAFMVYLGINVLSSLYLYSEKKKGAEKTLNDSGIQMITVEELNKKIQDTKNNMPDGDYNNDDDNTMQ